LCGRESASADKGGPLAAWRDLDLDAFAIADAGQRFGELIESEWRAKQWTGVDGARRHQVSGRAEAVDGPMHGGTANRGLVQHVGNSQ